LRREERSTRGKRMRAALEDESEGDQEFWNQEFWAEEAVDEDFRSEEEKEEEDIPDSDFDEPEDDDDDEEVEEKPMKDDAPKRKAPKAPEIKAPPRPRAPPKPKPTPAEREEAKLAALEAMEAPTLRKSTKARTMEAAKERQVRVQSATRRSTPKSRANWQPLTQADLLAEAARTEVENIQSLKLLMAMEEATKRKAAVVKQHYTGPLVKLVSKRRLKEVQPGQEDPAPTPAAPVAPGQPSAPTPAPAPPHTPGGPTPQTPAPAPPQSTPGAQPANGPTSAAPASGPSPPRETPGAGGGAAGPSGAQTPAAAAAAAAAAGGLPRGSDAQNATPSGNGGSAAASTPANGMDIDGSVSDKREGGPGVPGTTTATPMSGMDVDGRSGPGGSDGPQGDAAAGEQGGGGEDAAAAAEVAAAKAAKDLENDGRRYEATVSYEICNMPYPPMWLRRFRALPPPPLQKCAITGMPARYRDPATGRVYANPAAFRRLHPERQVTPTQPLPLDQVRLTSSSSVQGEPAPPPELSCSSGGGADLMGSSLVRGSSRAGGAGVLQGCRAFLNAAAHTSTQLLPPEPDVLPEPSTHFPLLPPMALPQDMVALVTELHGPA